MNIKQKTQKHSLDSLRSEAEIKENWSTTDGEPLVSVVCMCFNHEEYIEDALCSFFMQKTDFPFEVLVHDDASTDGSAAIIRRFEARYPSIIRAIYQTENQFSLGRRQGAATREKSRGRYIAMCEGDDYWIAADKLQWQFDVMEARPDVSMCFHAAYTEDAKSGERLEEICMHSSEDCYVGLKPMILGGGGYCPTNSLFFRKDAVADMPHFMRECPVGDAAIQMMCALSGKIYYLPFVMSVYRTKVSDSWTARMSVDFARIIQHNAEVTKFYRSLDKHLNGKYRVTIARKLVRNLFRLGLRGGALQIDFFKFWSVLIKYRINFPLSYGFAVAGYIISRSKSLLKK